MPAQSKQQQKFMGIVRAIQKGDQPASKFSKKAQDAADDMKKKDVEDFASTKHKGLPKKVEQELRERIRAMVEDYVESCGYTMSAVDPKYKLKSPGATGEEDRELKEEGFGSDEFLTKTEKKKFEKERLENAEVLGYKLTGTKDLKEYIDLTPSHIELLRRTYDTVKGINATGGAYKNLVRFLDNLPKKSLMMVAKGNIKFVSQLAKNRLKTSKKESVNEASQNYDKALEKMLNFMKKSAYLQYKKSFDVYIKTDTWEYPTLLKKGKTFDKIVTVRNNEPKKPQSVAFFVNRETGDIYKPASYSAPAKGVRGNIFHPRTYARYDIHGSWLYKIQKIAVYR